MQQSGITILVIDDEPEVSMIFSKILAEHGHALKDCTTAEDGLAMVHGGLAPAIIFLDIRLPGMDGLSALGEFLKINPHLKVVMMTAFQTVDSVVRAMKTGAVDYLVKPLDPEMILKAVQKYAVPVAGPGESPQAAASEPPPVLGSVPPLPKTFVAHTPAMQSVLSVAEKFAATEGTVLILGESGSGKELLAHYLHEKSRRSGKPFVVVDCASIPESLFESELFGYEKGAFTGADTPKAGRFELASKGTLFLDEIGNVPLLMQAKLLRFIEDHTVSRLGGKKSTVLDLRLVAATNVDLRSVVEQGLFREDLYYRISALMIRIPPLRNRPKEEKEFLTGHFLEKFAKSVSKPVLQLDETAKRLIQDYPWPGNVRELQNALHSATILCSGPTLEVSHLPVGIQSYLTHRQDSSRVSDGSQENRTLREILDKVEREQILAVLKQTGGNKKKASEILDMDYKNFLTKLKKYFQDMQESGE